MQPVDQQQNQSDASSNARTSVPNQQAANDDRPSSQISDTHQYSSYAARETVPQESSGASGTMQPVHPRPKQPEIVADTAGEPESTAPNEQRDNNTAAQNNNNTRSSDSMGIAQHVERPQDHASATPEATALDDLTRAVCKDIAEEYENGTRGLPLL